MTASAKPDTETTLRAEIAELHRRLSDTQAAEVCQLEINMALIERIGGLKAKAEDLEAEITDLKLEIVRLEAVEFQSRSEVGA